MAKSEVQKVVAQYVPVVAVKSERVTVSCQKVVESNNLALFAEATKQLASPDPRPVQYTVTLILNEEEYQLL